MRSAQNRYSPNHLLLGMSQPSCRAYLDAFQARFVGRGNYSINFECRYETSHVNAAITNGMFGTPHNQRLLACSTWVPNLSVPPFFSSPRTRAFTMAPLPPIG